MDHIPILSLLFWLHGSLGHMMQFMQITSSRLDHDGIISSHLVITEISCIYLCIHSAECRSCCYDNTSYECTLSRQPIYTTNISHVFIAGEALTYCNFEAGMCGWAQSTDDDFQWTLHSGPTGSVDTGPSFDHTKGTAEGTYLYIEATWQQHGDVAVLESDMFEASSSVRFYYHMYGSAINSLSLYMTSDDGTIQKWTKSGDQGDQWWYANVNLVSAKPYRIMFVASTGDYFTGDIALDDIEVTVFSSCWGHI